MQKHLENVRFSHSYIADEPFPSCNGPKGTKAFECRLCHFTSPKSTFNPPEMISLSLFEEMKVCLFKCRQIKFDNSRIPPLK